MTDVIEHRFPVAVSWTGERLTRASAADKPELDVATPPVFPGGIEGVWSPEELLVAATASCYAVTLVAIAERKRVPLRSLSVAGDGRLGKRADGRYGFLDVELDVDLETEPGMEGLAEQAARAAERHCLIAASLDLPVRVTVGARAARLAPTG